MTERRKPNEINDNVTLYESNRDMYIENTIMNNTSSDTVNWLYIEKKTLEGIGHIINGYNNMPGSA